MAKSKKKVVVRGRARNGSGRNNGYGQDQSGWTLERRIADVHRFVRRDFVPVDPGSAGVGVGYALSFSLDQLPNYTDFTNLFDHYVIEAVDITLIPGINAVQIAYCPDLMMRWRPQALRTCWSVSVVRLVWLVHCPTSKLNVGLSLVFQLSLVALLDRC